MIRRIGLVAGTIFTEALRRREIYVIVLVTVAMLVLASTIRFFDLANLTKFYHEVSLKVMSMATALTVIVLGARQLPREFENRTIYPLMAKPVARWEFLAGKYLGTVAAGGFCLGLFMGVFLVGWLLHRPELSWVLFVEFVYLQLLLVMVLAALSFALSMLMAVDAAITVTTLLFLLGHVLTNALTMLYEYLGALGQWMLIGLNYLVPQPALFDLSGKLVHGWDPIGWEIVLLATAYALMFVLPYLALSYVLFRRKPL